jgi:hypothetical protein
MNISFSMTTAQVKARTKFVTRRVGWLWIVAASERGVRPVLQPIVKGQGLKKGEHAEPIGGPIRVLIAWREPVKALVDGTYSPAMARREVDREGFPEMSPAEFVRFFCKGHKCQPRRVITRIEFEYF